LARLSVFAGCCTLGAAEQVCGVDRALDRLAALVDHSLLQSGATGHGETRFTMLETIRAYAATRLAQSGDEPETRRRHAEYFALLAERVEPDLKSLGDATALDRVEADHDNFRAAMNWAAASGRGDLSMRLAAALYLFWLFRGPLDEAAERLDAALAAGGERGALRAKVLRGRTVVRAAMGRLDEAQADARELVAVADRMTDAPLRAHLLDAVGFVAQQAADYERARAIHEEIAALSRSSGDALQLCIALNNLADIALNQSRFDDAAALSKETLAVALAVGNAERAGTALLNSGSALLGLGRNAEAARRFVDSLREARRLGLPAAIGFALDGLGAVAAMLGRYEAAARILGAADATLEVAGATLQTFEQQRRARVLARIEQSLEPSVFAAARSEGRRLSLDDATELLTAHVAIGRPS
jgi:non-specific serine/threonine protein kinase